MARVTASAGIAGFNVPKFKRTEFSALFWAVPATLSSPPGDTVCSRKSGITSPPVGALVLRLTDEGASVNMLGEGARVKAKGVGAVVVTFVGDIDGIVRLVGATVPMKNGVGAVVTNDVGAEVVGRGATVGTAGLGGLKTFLSIAGT